MKLKFLIALILFVTFINSVKAEPSNGFGLNIGGTGNIMNSTYTAASAGNSVGSTSSYNSSGVSFGMDYQIVYPNNLTLNPFLMASAESTSLSSQADTVMNHSILGLQGRSWRGDVFLGVHGAIYSETLSSSTGTNSTTTTTSITGSGTGEGIIVGWEPSNSNWTVSLQADSAKIKYTNQEVNMTGARLNIGYRWK